MNNLSSLLLVEDNEDDVFLLQRAFTKVDVRNPVHVARDGQEAIDYLGQFVERKQHRLPCLMILDLKMPRKTGLDVLEWKREQGVLVCLPVIVFSSSFHTSDIDRAYYLGANAFIVKPVCMDKCIALASLIKEFWVELNQTYDAMESLDLGWQGSKILA